MQLKFYQKKPEMAQNGIGAWQDVLEILGYTTVIINCVFLYWFRIEFIGNA